MQLLFIGLVLPAFSQDSTMMRSSKKFNTFSIGVNAGVLAPISPIGGSNDFTKWEPTLGYGLYIKNQFTHYLAVQADFFRGTLKGNNDNKLGNGAQTSNPYQSFKTNLNWAASLSGVVTFGNINWLSDKNAIIPYVSLGGGIAGYKPVLNEGSNEIDYKTDDKNIQEFFVPVGAGLKIAAAPNLNIDLGFKMNYVDGDNLDGYVNGYHKDKFSYGFAGLEFSLGKSGQKQLMLDNPVADFKRDLMDENEALRASVTATANQNAAEIDSLQNEINRLKTDSDNDGVADYLDKCPNTPDSVKVDGSGCALPKLQPPPPPQTTVVITAEDRRTVDEAIRNLQFETGKSNIKASSYPSLDRVAAILVNKNFSLKLAGHTDNVGSDVSNMKLSKDRAEAVKTYLVSKGANPSRIEATGYGESQPIASNKTAAGRAKNRRVEFTLF